MKKKIIAFVIIAVIFIFIGKALYQNWAQIPFEKLKFNPLFLISSYVCMAFCLMLGASQWKLCLECVDEKISFWKAIQILSVVRLGAYVPGKIWSILGRVYLAKQEGIPARKTSASAILEIVLSVLSPLLISMIFLGLFAKKPAPVNMYLVFVLVALCFIGLYPPLFMKVVNWGLKIIKQEPVEFNLHYTQLLKILSLYLLHWVVLGLCFYLLINSFYPIAFRMFPALASLQAIAWVVGFVSVIAPGGLGVQEGVLSILLKSYLPVSIGIIVALLMRVWVLIGILSFALIFGKESARNLSKK